MIDWQNFSDQCKTLRVDMERQLASLLASADCDEAMREAVLRAVGPALDAAAVPFSMALPPGDPVAAGAKVSAALSEWHYRILVDLIVHITKLEVRLYLTERT